MYPPPLLPVGVAISFHSRAAYSASEVSARHHGVCSLAFWKKPMRSLKIFFLSLLAAVSLLVTACGEDKVEITATEFVTAFTSGDVDGVLKHIEGGDELSENDLKAAKGKLKLVVTAVAEEVKAKGGMAKFEIVSRQEQNDGATVILKTKTTFGDGSSEDGEMTLVRTANGDYKIQG